MRTSAPIITMLATLMLVPLPAQSGEHAAATGRSSTAAAPYPPDAALQLAMERVRAAVSAFEHARHGHMGAEQLLALSTHLDAQVMRVFKECKLEPQADASLHSLLGILLEGSRAMREAPGDFTPVAAMERAMLDYDRLFEASGQNVGR